MHTGRDERLMELQGRLAAAETAAAAVTASTAADDGGNRIASSQADAASLQNQVTQLKKEVLAARQRYLDLADILNVNGSQDQNSGLVQSPGSSRSASAVSPGRNNFEGVHPKGLPELLRRSQTRKGLYALQLLAIQGVLQGICINAS